MKKIYIFIIVIGIILVNTGCTEKTVTTEDNVFRLEKKSETLVSKEEQKNNEFDLEKWKQELPLKIKTEIADERICIKIDADIIMPPISKVPGKYKAEIVSLEKREREILVDALWKEKAESIKNNTSYDKYGFYEDDMGSRLMFDKTILYSNANDKPFDINYRSFSKNQADNIKMSMEEAGFECKEILGKIGYGDMDLVSPGVVRPINWSSYVTDKGYYYLGFSQSVENLSIMGWVDTQNVWDVYLGPGNRTAPVFFSVDDTGIFNIYGNLYRVSLTEESEKLLSMDEIMEQLEKQLAAIVISGRKGKYGTTQKGIMSEIPICKMELVYLINATEKQELYLAPYWKLSIGETKADGELFTNICIHAVTGEVGLCND